MRYFNKLLPFFIVLLLTACATTEPTPQSSTNPEETTNIEVSHTLTPEPLEEKEEEIENNIIEELGDAKVILHDSAMHDVYQAALQGNATSQCALGLAYYEGKNLPQNYLNAFEWFHKSSAQENALAQRYLGRMYKRGEGTTQDYVQAIVWYKKAAHQENSEAQYNLAIMYLEGLGTAKNDIKAFEWFEKAAIQGYVYAQHNLGIMYCMGAGIPQNDAKAFEWIEKSAKQGNASSQALLGVFYELGQGIPQSSIKAYAHYSIANALGEDNTEVMDIYREEMTSAQIAEAQALAEKLWNELPKE